MSNKNKMREHNPIKHNSKRSSNKMPHPEGEEQQYRSRKFTSSDSCQDMSEDMYLNKYGIDAYLKDVTTLMLENRPEDPIHFMADYFYNVVQGSSPMVRSYRFIRLTDRHRDVFFDNLVAAYNSLAHRRSSDNVDPSASSSSSSASSADPRIVTGEDLSKLLRMLCRDFPPDLLRAIFAVLGKDPVQSVPFEQFASAVNACLLYEEFLVEAEETFEQADREGRGCLSTSQFEELLHRMKVGSMGNRFPDATLISKVVKRCRERVQRAGGKEAKVTFHDFVQSLFDLSLPQQCQNTW
eukprot:gb/GECH01010544.1/.p1 GENE.gb/GECH01010544.1/~~gb/GECH01010544.1/.p1  ORF type:complete len:296 (+),score=38.75 gb/GECH01010544.1/:1-888(+)